MHPGCLIYNTGEMLLHGVSAWRTSSGAIKHMCHKVPRDLDEDSNAAFIGATQNRNP